MSRENGQPEQQQNQSVGARSKRETLEYQALDGFMGQSLTHREKGGVKSFLPCRPLATLVLRPTNDYLNFKPRSEVWPQIHARTVPIRWATFVCLAGGCARHPGAVYCGAFLASRQLLSGVP